MIIASGYNVYPRDVEEVIYEHPAVHECCVAGVPDAYRGETVKAFVVLRPGATLTADELDAFCRERLAVFKVPKIVEFRDSLPKSAVGKILRRVLISQ
jgi:long-chain acyl-CoA synthetase